MPQRQWPENKAAEKTTAFSLSPMIMKSLRVEKRFVPMTMAETPSRNLNNPSSPKYARGNFKIRITSLTAWGLEHVIDTRTLS